MEGFVCVVLKISWVPQEGQKLLGDYEVFFPEKKKKKTRKIGKERSSDLLRSDVHVLHIFAAVWAIFELKVIESDVGKKTKNEKC